MKITTRKITYNNKPDPITSIKEYKIDENGKRVLVKEDKPLEGKTYALTGLGKCIANGNTWKESEVK